MCSEGGSEHVAGLGFAATPQVTDAANAAISKRENIFMVVVVCVGSMLGTQWGTKILFWVFWRTRSVNVDRVVVAIY
jgi:hypothetical protein